MKLAAIVFGLFGLVSSLVISALTPLYIPARSYNASGYQDLLDRLGIPEQHEGSWYGVLHIVPEYRRTFNGSDIVRSMLFNPTTLERCTDKQEGCSDPLFIEIAGSRVKDRNNTAWLADYFGLSPEHKSCIRLDPYRDAFLTRATFYLAHQGCWTDYFLYIYAPIVSVRTSLDVHETKQAEPTTGYDEGYFASTAIPLTDLHSSFLQYVHGTSTLNLPDTIRFETLECARWVEQCNRLSETGVADFKVQLGCNIADYSWLFLQLFAIAGAPTGNSPDGRFFFEPIIGNGGHPELGGGLYSTINISDNTDTGTSTSFHVYGWATHMFANTQCRFFNLKNKTASIYMLAEKLSIPVTDDLWSNPLPGNQNGSTQPNTQFKKVFAPIANLTCIPVTVGIDVQGEVVGMLNYSNANISYNIGYSFWGRSCENIEIVDSCINKLDELSRWALKGDAHVFGFSEFDNSAIALSATESMATIRDGTNNFVGPDGSAGGIDGIGPTRNPGVDNAQFARTGPTSTAESILNVSGPTGLQTKTSNQPLLLSCADVDICASSASRSHTLFGQIAYLLAQQCGWQAYVATGAKVEWSQFSSTDCTKEQKQCVRRGYSELGVWLRAGIGFN